MATQQKFNQFKEYVARKIPGFEIRMKGKSYPDDPWYRPLVDRVARWFAPEYNTRFATTIYPFVYIPETWLVSPNTMYGMLRHEYIHLRDEQKYGWLYRLSYVLLLPAIFTMRSFWEYRGYSQNLIRSFERHGMVDDGQIANAISNFVGSTYGWMDPFCGHARIAKLVERIENREITGLYPYEEGDWITEELNNG